MSSKIQTIQVDLSGRGGLAPRYFGDLPYDEGNQNLRTLALENQYVEGFCNPISKLGYMSPANATTKAVTPTYDYNISFYTYNSKYYVTTETSVNGIFLDQQEQLCMFLETIMMLFINIRFQLLGMLAQQLMIVKV